MNTNEKIEKINQFLKLENEILCIKLYGVTGGELVAESTLGDKSQRTLTCFTTPSVMEEHLNSLINIFEQEKKENDFENLNNFCKDFKENFSRISELNVTSTHIKAKFDFKGQDYVIDTTITKK